MSEPPVKIELDEEKKVSIYLPWGHEFKKVRILVKRKSNKLKNSWEIIFPFSLETYKVYNVMTVKHIFISF